MFPFLQKKQTIDLSGANVLQRQISKLRDNIIINSLVCFSAASRQLFLNVFIPPLLRCFTEGDRAGRFLFYDPVIKALRVFITNGMPDADRLPIYKLMPIPLIPPKP